MNKYKVFIKLTDYSKVRIFVDDLMKVKFKEARLDAFFIKHVVKWSFVLSEFTRFTCLRWGTIGVDQFLENISQYLIKYQSFDRGETFGSRAGRDPERFRSLYVNYNWEGGTGEWKVRTKAIIEREWTAEEGRPSDILIRAEHGEQKKMVYSKMHQTPYGIRTYDEIRLLFVHNQVVPSVKDI